MYFPDISRPLCPIQWRWARGIVLLGVAAGLGTTLACHGLLDVSNPTLVRDSDIANPQGANARRLDVSATVNSTVGQTVTDVALFTDEYYYDRIALTGAVAPTDPVFLDDRDSEGYEQNHTFAPAGGTDDPHLGTLDRIVTKADIAIPEIRAYTPDSLKGDFLAQMFALKAFAILQMAEDICPGFPINEVRDNRPVFNPPYSTDSALSYAVRQLDSATSYVKDSTRFLNLIRVLRGRALLDLGQYDAAANSVSDVPTDFTYGTESNNGIWRSAAYYAGGTYSGNIAVADKQGGNGLPFISAHDPRVPSIAVGPSKIEPSDQVYFSTKYSSSTAPIVVAGGIEARLIEAEVALQAGDPAWFATLNTLRATMSTPALPALDPMPATTAGQVDLLYSERAFWLYLTGHRLGDLRRLISHYGRDPETVFPTGTYLLGGGYKSATAIPFVFATERAQNPYLTSGCTTR